MHFREHREQANYSVAQVCAILGVSKMAVYNWEHGLGFPTVGNLLRLCALYKCTPNDLLL